MDRTTKPPSRTPPPSHPCPLTFHLPRAFRTEASIGAVREALANDITRLLGIPAQELSLVRGEYSDGHPKLMLAAKYAETFDGVEERMRAAETGLAALLGDLRGDTFDADALAALKAAVEGGGK